MPSKPTTNLELIEPLQSFLEKITQELTEQKFVPAMRDELKRLMSAIENLQQSEATMQQIARGVDRLREVFAPAGTRLLEGVKDLETVMRGNAEQLKERAGGVLNDLMHTHEQLEGALRNEAGLLHEQTAASRDALARTVAEVEARLSGLTTHVDGLCKKLESEAVSLAAAATPGGATVMATRAALSVPMTGELPSEIRDLIAHSEQTITHELESQRKEIQAALQHGKSEQNDRLVRIDQRITESLGTIGPRMQEELESAVTRLRDQIQTLILAEIETRAIKSTGTGGKITVPSGDITSALTASETRILREIATLQKTQKGEGASDKVLKELAQGFEKATQQLTERATGESEAIKESLAALQKVMTQLRDDERQTHSSLDGLARENREHRQSEQDELRATQSRLDQQAQAFEKKAEEDRRALSDLSAAMSRAEQAATAASELALTDGRAQRERIDASLKDLRERIERGQNAEADRLQETLKRVTESWNEALESLRDFVQKTVSGRADAMTSALQGIEARLVEGNKTSGATQRELQNEFKRAMTGLDERVEALKGSSETFTAGMEKHVKAVSTEVAALRAKQEQSLAVLKEAIRANYDENAAKLKEIIDNASDSFIKQTAIVPQALDRYAHLIQSLHQGDQLALQGIASDAKNMLALSAEKFDLLLTDSGATKKVFPLLDKKLEKQAAELEMIRKAQVRGDKEFAEIKSTITLNQERSDEQDRELKSEIGRTKAATTEGFDSIRGNLQEVKANLHAVTDENLPAFRRELNALIAAKFEFIETTLRDRQETLRKEIFDHLDADRDGNKRTHLIIAGLLGLSVLLQLLFHFSKTPGVGH